MNKCSCIPLRLYLQKQETGLWASLSFLGLGFWDAPQEKAFVARYV